MATNTWSSTGSTDANNPANWSLGALSADDTLTFDATSVVNATLTAAWTCAAVAVGTGYTGTLNLAGYAVGCGDCTLNVGGAGTELLVNAGFETAGAGDPDFFGTWAETVGDGAIAATTTAGEFRTVTAAKVTAGASANTKLAQTIAVTGSTAYRLIIWCRGDATNTGSYGLYDVTNSANITAKTSLAVTSATYTQKTYDFTTPATCVSLRLDLWCPAANGGIAYFDDISLTTFGTVNLSTSILTCDGNFDWSGAAGTITYGTSTLVMTGTGKNLKAPYSSSPSRFLYSFTSAAASSQTIPGTVVSTYFIGNVIVNGSVTDNGSSNVQVLGAFSQGSEGTWAGTGTLYWRGSVGTLANSSAIAPANIWVPQGVSLPPGTYSPTTAFTIVIAAAGTFTWNAGTYTFTSPVVFWHLLAGTGVVSGTNNPTLIFQSNVTTTIAAGDLSFSPLSTNPNQLTGTANQTLNLDGKNMGTWVLNKLSAGTVTFTSGDSIVAGGAWTMTALTVPAGVNMDLGDGSYSHSVSGDVTLDGATFDYGNSTLTVGGSFDIQHVTTITRGTSTLVLTGSGKNLVGNALLNSAYNLTIALGASYTITSDVHAYGGTVTINGSVVINSGKYFQPTRSDCIIGSSGSISGLGYFYLYGPLAGQGISSFAVGGSITCSFFYVYTPVATSVIAPGTYGAGTVQIWNSISGDYTWTPSAGTYTFTGNVIYSNTGTGSLTIDCSTNNPNITVGGNLTFTQSAGTLTYTKGTGTITLNSATAATLNTLGQAVEDIVVAKTATANTVTLGSNIVTDSLDLQTGTLSMGSGASNAMSCVAADKSWMQIADAVQTGLDLGTSDGAVALSVYLTSAVAGGIVGKGATGTSDGGYQLAVDANRKITLTFGDGSGAALITKTFTTALTLATPYDLVLNLDRDGNAELFVNGVSDGTVAISAQAASIDSTGVFSVGVIGTSYFNGRVGFVRQWSRLLTAASITRQANMIGGAHYARPYTQLTTAEKVNLISAYDQPTAPSFTTWSDLHSTNHLAFASANIIGGATLNGDMESVTAGTEELTNPGFETVTSVGPPANFGTWAEYVSDGNIEVETTIIHGGAKSAKLTSGASKDTSVYMNQAVTVGARRLTFWAAGDATNSGRYGVYDITHSAWIRTLVSTGVTSTTMAQVTYEFAVPDGCTAIYVYFYCPNAVGGVAYFDDVSLKPLSPTNWIKSELGTSKVQVELTAPQAGTYATRLDVDGSNSLDSISQTVTTIGKSYTASAYLKAPTGAPTVIFGGGGSAAQYNTGNITNSYVLYTGTFTTDSTLFYIVRASAASNSIYIDNVTLAAANCLTAAGPPTINAITTTGNLSIGIAGQVSVATLAGCVWTVGGNLSLTGESGDLLLLNATAGWNLNVVGSAAASYVNVAYSNASGGCSIMATNTTNSLNNTNWIFQPYVASGGVVTGGVGTTAYGRDWSNYTASGGAVTGGVGVTVWSEDWANYVATGGAVAGGAGITTLATMDWLNYTASGGVVTGGVSPTVYTEDWANYTPSGGVTVAGDGAYVEWTNDWTNYDGSGGAVTGGAAITVMWGGPMVPGPYVALAAEVGVLGSLASEVGVLGSLASEVGVLGALAAEAFPE